MNILVLISRILVGVLFIFSGFIKANDVVGFSYKMEEYFAVFGMEWLVPAALVLAALICILEIVIGAATLIGAKMNIVAPLLLVMILFFTWLTGYSAVTGKVTDCGCFGDAIKLTPWESFYKDVILLALILIIFVKRKTIEPLLPAKASNIVLIGTTIATAAFTFIGWYYLPMIDFRPYKVGANIPGLMAIPEDASPGRYETVFIYKNKKTGEQKEFRNTTPKDYENWEFVDRRDIEIEAPYEPPIHDFNILTDDGEDITNEALSESDYLFWVITYNINTADKSAFEEIQALADKAQQGGYKFMGLTASGYSDIEKVRHEHNLAFPFHYVDATALKTMIRANPGLMLIKNGIIVDKWDNHALPDYEKLERKYFNP